MFSSFSSSLLLHVSEVTVSAAVNEFNANSFIKICSLVYDAFLILKPQEATSLLVENVSRGFQEANKLATTATWIKL